MTHILVLSDTHWPHDDAEWRNPEPEESKASLFEDLADLLRQADLILHAGDHVAASFHRELQERGYLVFVRGNMDEPQLQANLPPRAVITCEGVKIGLVHGWGPPAGLAERIYHSWLPEERPEVIVFGHSHQSGQGILHETLMVNPGSPTYPRGPEGPSVGWLEVHRGRCQASILPRPRRGAASR
ncbi:MAG: YfcE family phosphodiesterase [Candidatus Zixiibacteriota bacterium]|nr:MAG: YfcE family phosphodiesterase [candidate division Zixibacteria bacterium]